MNTKGFRGAKIFIGGIQGSGKTELGKFLVKKHFRKVVSIRVTRDYDSIPNMVLIQPSKNHADDLESLAKYLREQGKLYESGRIPEMPYDCLLVDEADLFFSTNFDIRENMNDLILLHRHYDLAIVFITRRPQDIPARIHESCRHQFYFKIEGKNVSARLSGIDETLPSYVEKLDFDKHNFVYKELGREPIVHKALKL
jgi:DNA helicase HerA-like ATPase